MSVRIQQLELEIRKGNHGKRGAEATANPDANLSEELAKTKKDLETVERMAKQSDANSKAKDAQLKRAIETIGRLKSQLQEVQQNATVSCYDSS
jgi:lipid II:glycine glycyltransferase (peptidoglycan interpeptide bridge formation enzyme)